MKIQLMSDLHLESQPDFQPEPASGAELLVLAGDIGAYPPIGSQLSDPYFGLARFSPLANYAHWPTPVLFVPGNHEFDGQELHAAHARLRKVCEDLGIIWLEREQWEHQGVRFVGTTLWTDFDALIPEDLPESARAKHREKAFRAANFYLKKTGAIVDDRPFWAEAMREQGLVCQDWLTQALCTPFDGPTVVVTHFAPSLRSADPRYGLVPGTAGFCSRLDHLLPHAQLWLHGHLHTPLDYRAGGVNAQGESWQCRVVANPLGYAHKGEQSGFSAQCVIDL